jgi:GNAT superfamily N-acetyltransferase
MPTICRAALAGGMSQRSRSEPSHPYLIGLIDAGTLEVRPAARADAPALTTLLHELGYPSNTGEEVSGRLARWSGRDDLLVLVTAARQQVVGVAALAVVPYFERPGCWGRVVALVVDARARGLGVGRRLLAATEHAALARGCVRMEITSARRRTGAHAFYRSLGYADVCDGSARFLKDIHLTEDLTDR